MDKIIQTKIQWLPEHTYSVTYPFVRMAQVAWVVGAASTPVNLLRAPDQVVAAFGVGSLVASAVSFLFLTCLVAALACTLNRAIGLVLALMFIIGAIGVATAPFGHMNPIRWSIPNNLAIGLLFGGAYYLYVAQLGIRAGVMWAFCRSFSKRVIAELHGPPLVSLNTLSKVLGLPTPIQHVKLRRWRAVSLFAVSSISFAGASALIFVGPVIPAAILMTADLPRPAGTTWLPGYDRTTVAAVNLLIVILVVIALIIVGALARRAGRQTIRSSLQKLQSLDARAPILFLRAFRDDQVALEPSRLPLLGYLYDIGNRKTSLDVMLLEEGTEFGPVVALGNPTDPVPPYGAARGYFTDESWQEGVRRLAQDSVALVICLDDTPGVWWEVDHIRENELYAKTLFLLHPRFRSINAANALLSKVIDRLDIHETLDLANQALLSGSPQTGNSIIGFFLDPDGAWQVGLSPSGSRVGYLLILRWFLRSRLQAACSPAETETAPPLTPVALCRRWTKSASNRSRPRVAR